MFCRAGFLFSRCTCTCTCMQDWIWGILASLDTVSKHATWQAPCVSPSTYDPHGNAQPEVNDDTQMESELHFQNKTAFSNTHQPRDASCYLSAVTQIFVQDCQWTMPMEIRSQRPMATQRWSQSLMPTAQRRTCLTPTPMLKPPKKPPTS